MIKYRQYCPVARASEIFADRWTPLIVRELLAGSRQFNRIDRGLPGISRSLLVSRLRQLEDAGVVERRQGGRRTATEYHLTEAGRDLQRVVDRLGAWGVRWAFGEPKRDELDPVLLLWKMHQRVRHDLLPPKRTVVEFDFTGHNGRRLWLVLEPREISVCLKPPGFDTDLMVRANLAFFYRVWLGYVDYDDAVQSKAIIVDGPRTLAREFPRWFTWSPMARFVRMERDRWAVAPS
ncbi:MAG TPA: helix-turn-helix domain-containing protein [Terriglobia bacterium]|jgi:DNA-binding HxlR family transcriptional regulator|nr:helix-turn-helix domain-containing protein [Terriglobia bacterium]